MFNIFKIFDELDDGEDYDYTEEEARRLDRESLQWEDRFKLKEMREHRKREKDNWL